ncbi:MAG: hypothetical protein TQ37_05835 [Candidatus Synechococcus spongiarum 15L]|uniref:Uncharacterized protein n=1 Tax=Candidatus Synechococcus spongiarum 15L TaxID=1608419 RepID=A0A0G8AUQ3_9SYNE|nr:MAG: hypothetical protein TQ37_05835 [Candidatus Synechococcus spongiarum 15L]
MGLLMLGLGAMPALAIPEAEAIRKLAAVAVYVVVDPEGWPALYPESPDRLVLPMFMKAEQAQQARRTLEERQDTEGSRVVPMSLDIAFELNKNLRQAIPVHKSLIMQLEPAQEDWEKAKEIRLAEGIDQGEIDRNLKVPVFFTNPSITFTPPGTEEAKVAFFFNYSQLQQAKQAVPDSNLDSEDKVMDLFLLIDLMIQDEEDKYFLSPTEDWLKIIQAQQEQQSSPSQAQPSQDQQDVQEPDQQEAQQTP